MAKDGNNRKNNYKENYGLKSQTKHVIIAIVFFVLALFLLMSKFNMAGVAGVFIDEKIHFLLGIGDILLPALFILLGTSFIKSQENLTTQDIGLYPEIQSYRKIYKEMGIDWHSKRPSPEALLRRIARKKGLYEINTCVDAYNLIVMKYRVSSGAFDLDQIKPPTVLRFPKPGEEILLLGDDQPTKYNPTDLAYFDQIGGYNLYFNYRDAQRTAVTEKTKNILLNIDGIYDITREMVEQTLRENIEIITKYCGGKVELAGIVSAK